MPPKERKFAKDAPMYSDNDVAYNDALNAIEASCDSEAAFGVMLDLARSGYVCAMNYVANCYAAGLAVEKNPQEALRWWRKGAASGDTLCMINMATEYRDTLGNLRRAKWWLKRAADVGNVDANLELAEIYFGIDKVKYSTEICNLLSSVKMSGEFLSEDQQNRIEDMFRQLGLAGGSYSV